MASPEPQVSTPLEARAKGKESHDAPIHDTLCIGFGATGVALAVALDEQRPNLKVHFVEQQSRRAWKPFALGAGERMRTIFLDDLITAKNPRSEFTYVNYLHAAKELVDFTNMGDMKPSSYQYSQYLSWCAGHFKDQVVYGKKVLRVEPVWHDSGVITHWKVVTRDLVSNKTQSMFAKRVISAVGKQPRISTSLSPASVAGKLLHASDCLEALEDLLQPSQPARNVALVGDGQHAAEIFMKFHTELSPHKITWFSQEPVLRPRSDAAFATNILQQPNLPQPFLDYPPELRRHYLLSQGASHPANAIDLDIVNKIYDLQYDLRVKRADESTWPCQIRSYMEVASSERVEGGQVKLSLRDLRTGSVSADEAPFDLVISATGYERTEYMRILKGLESLSEEGNLTVDREYRLNLVKRSVSPGVGIWILGSLEDADDDDNLTFLTLQSKSFRLTNSVVVESEKASEVTERVSRL